MSLRRLRAAGVHDLARLRSLSPESLAEMLGARPDRVARFLAEALALERRLEGEPDSGVLQPSRPARVSRSSALDRSPAGIVEEPHAPGSQVEEGRPGGSAGELRESPGSDPASALEEPLRPGLLPGLDRATCEALVHAEVRTLWEMAQGGGPGSRPALGRFVHAAARAPLPSPAACRRCAARPALDRSCDALAARTRPRATARRTGLAGTVRLTTFPSLCARHSGKGERPSRDHQRR